MTPEQSVLAIDQELNLFLSLFDHVSQACILFDSDRQIVYRNNACSTRFPHKILSVHHIEEELPNLDRNLIEFLELNTLTSVVRYPFEQVELRRIVKVDSEYVLATFNQLESAPEVIKNKKTRVKSPVSPWFKSLINNAPEAILILDFENKRYVDANPMAIRLFGYSKKELLTTYVGDLSPEVLPDGRSARAVSTQKIQQCIDTGKSVKFNWSIKRADGSLVPCEVRVHRLPTESGIYIRSSVTDVSFKMKAEAEIGSRKEQFRQLFASESFSMVLYDHNGEIQVANQAFCNMLGYKLRSLKNTSIHTLIYAEDLKLHTERLESLNKGDQVESGNELRLLRSDGKFVTCFSSAKRYQNFKGEQFVVETLRDVSQEKMALQALEVSEKRYKSLFVRSTIGIVLIDYHKGQIVSANPMAQHILDRDEEEIKAMNYACFSSEFFGEKLDLFQDFLDRINRGENPMIDINLAGKNGSVISIRVGGYLLDGDDDGTLVVGFTDITEGNRRKQKYVRQRNQLKAFVEHSTIPVAMFDTEMNYVLVGQKWLEMYPTHYGGDIIGKNYYELHPGVPIRWKLKHMKAMSGETIQNDRDLLVKSNGQKEWFKWLAKPWYEDDHKIGGIIVYAEIITDEVSAEENAKKQEARYKSFFENSALGWVELDARHLVDYCRKSNSTLFSEREAIKLFNSCKVVRINDQVRDVFQFGNGKVEDFVPSKYVRENGRTFVQRIVQSIRNNVTLFEHDLVIKNEGDVHRNLFVSVRLPEDDDYTNIVCSILDVTDQRTSISALRDSEERYRTMFEGNNLAVVYTNYKKKTIKVNMAFTEMLGYTDSEMQTIHENDLLYPKYRKLNDDIEQKFKQGTVRQIDIDKEYKRKDGSRLIASTSSSALYDDRGSHYGTVTIINDITNRRLNERRIQRQNDELRKINQELDQFVYSAAHDLRAPIANVLGLVKLLKLEDLPVSAMEYVNLQERSLDKLDVFIKSIVDYSRNSRLAITKNELDFKPYIHDITEQYAFFDNADRLKVSVEVQQNGSFVTDESRLSIVMNNLVSNAVRYMDIEKKDSFLDIKVVSDQKEATIVVEDNGIGIEGEHLDSIFKLFYRANASSKGTGIGLYIVKEAIAKLKGTISVKSTYGVGTQFTVRIKNLA